MLLTLLISWMTAKSTWHLWATLLLMCTMYVLSSVIWWWFFLLLLLLLLLLLCCTGRLHRTSLKDVVSDCWYCCCNYYWCTDLAENFFSFFCSSQIEKVKKKQQIDLWFACCVWINWRNKWLVNKKNPWNVFDKTTLPKIMCTPPTDGCASQKKSLSTEPSNNTKKTTNIDQISVWLFDY